jgi:hypothetical protein
MRHPIELYCAIWTPPKNQINIRVVSKLISRDGRALCAQHGNAVSPRPTMSTSILKNRIRYLKIFRRSDNRM